jgi:hypothetical protein
MSDIKTWIMQEWPTLTAALGIGSGSSVLAKKLIDKEQDKKIKEIEIDISQIKTRLEISLALDKERQKEIAEKMDKIDKRFDRTDDKLDRILENQNKRIR